MKILQQLRVTQTALFPHNRVAYENALNMMSIKGKAAIILPTGTGRSFVAFKPRENTPNL